jgi:hypothetical protein
LERSVPNRERRDRLLVPRAHSHWRKALSSSRTDKVESPLQRMFPLVGGITRLGKFSVATSRGESYLSPLVPHGPSHPSGRGVLRRQRGKCTETGAASDRSRSVLPERMADPSSRPLLDSPLVSAESPRSSLALRGSFPVTTERFHVLLNPLFKVLCNFPSRYLFAIGLVELFSLGWNLPPA